MLGGTFDPVHNGHLGIADSACQGLGLAKVLFVPARSPWQKGERSIAPAKHRVEMLKLAIASDPRYNISHVDLERRGPSYTVDTLSDIGREVGTSVDLYFILGMDAMNGLIQWKEPERIVAMCHLIVARRPSVGAVDLETLERRLPGVSKKVVVIDNNMYDINSTDIRRRVAAGRSVADLVPQEVALYIGRNGLYQKEG